jgi:haloacetate dehalogenase
MSKRSMAAVLVGLMRHLGHERFAVVGHDRGGRVAYRMALDHAGAVAAVAVLDVVPTVEVWERADARFALSFWPFSLLAQPAPLPEKLISAAPDAIIDNALAEWGSSPDTFPPWLRKVYLDVLRDPAHAHAICEEYRAAATIDREIDKTDRDAAHRIDCSLLVLWSKGGALDDWYEDVGGPVGLWRRWADDVRGQAVGGGHFFPEERPEMTASLLREFFRDVAK